jgi:hypothetical protein
MYTRFAPSISKKNTFICSWSIETAVLAMVAAICCMKAEMGETSLVIQVYRIFALHDLCLSVT